MKSKSKDLKTRITRIGIFSLSALLIASVATILNDNGTQQAYAAKAKIVNIDEGWKYEKHLTWEHKTTLRAIIQSKINILNITNDKIYGSITDGNGTIIKIYGKESVVLAQFGYDSTFSEKWHIVARPSKGQFSFSIPEEYRNADYVRLWVNSNNFVIQPGESRNETYSQGTNSVSVDKDGLFVVKGYPTHISQGIAEEIHECYQGEIGVKVNSSLGYYKLPDTSLERTPNTS